MRKALRDPASGSSDTRPSALTPPSGPAQVPGVSAQLYTQS